MLFTRCLPAFFLLALALVQAAPRALRQATRAQIVSRMSKGSLTTKQRRQASPVPLPRSGCADYTSTGTVPYAKFTGLDYDSPSGAVLYNNIATRDQCVAICERQSACVGTTYRTSTQQCFTIVTINNYFQGQFDVTRKGITCASPEAVNALSRFPAATCCTQYRIAA